MKKNLLLKTFAALLLLLATTAADAADASRQLLALEKYTVPVGVPGAVVGRFTTEAAVTLADDPSGLFEIVNNELKLRKKAVVTASSPMLFEIGVAYGDAQKTITIVKDEFYRNKVVAHRRSGGRDTDTTRIRAIRCAKPSNWGAKPRNSTSGSRRTSTSPSTTTTSTTA